MIEATGYVAHVDFSSMRVGPLNSPFSGDQDVWVGGLIWGSEGNDLNIHTGIQNGPVNVQIVAGLLAPTENDFDSWEDVSEVSFQILEDSRVVAVGDDDFGGENDPAATFPALNIRGGDEWHRLRVHARGRDKSAGDYVKDATEDYLLVTWPAPPSDPIVFKADSKLAKYTIEATAPDEGFGE